MEELKKFYDKYFEYMTVKQMEYIWCKFVNKISFFEDDITKKELLDFIKGWGKDIET